MEKIIYKYKIYGGVMRVPKHIGIIPDGNRRWAVSNNLTKDQGYEKWINPGYELFKIFQKEKI